MRILLILFIVAPFFISGEPSHNEPFRGVNVYRHYIDPLEANFMEWSSPFNPDNPTPFEAWKYNEKKDLWYVDVSTYGAVGNGTTDDSSDLQTAFDSGNNLEFGSGLNYRVTQQIEIDQAGTQTITGNDATIMMTTGQLTGFSTAAVIRIDKRTAGGVTYIDELNIDANEHAAQGYNVHSSFEIENVDITDMYVPITDNTQAAGITVFLNQPTAGNSISFSNSLINNVNISNITAISSDGAIAGSGVGDGNAKGIQIAAYGGTVSNDVTITNFTIDGVWGDDADCLDFFLFDLHESWSGTTVISNGVISNGARRLFKLTFPNTTVFNVEFNETSASNPNIQFSGAACCGISVFRTVSQTPLNRNIVFREITYNGQATPFFGNFDFVITSTQDITIEGSTFNNGILWFQQSTEGNGDIFVIGNTWADANSYIDDYNSGTLWDSGTGIYLTNNTTNGATLNQLSSSGSAPSAPISCYNGVQDGDETSIDTGGSCSEEPPVFTSGIRISTKQVKINAGTVKIVN